VANHLLKNCRAPLGLSFGCVARPFRMRWIGF
jgi:hypothetical protein